MKVYDWRMATSRHDNSSMGSNATIMALAATGALLPNGWDMYGYLNGTRMSHLISDKGKNKYMFLFDVGVGVFYNVPDTHMFPEDEVCVW